MNGSAEFPPENQENTPNNTSIPPQTENDAEFNSAVEKTQNDLLNKRLLCSFMEKLNQTQEKPCEESAFNVENESNEFDDE